MSLTAIGIGLGIKEHVQGKLLTVQGLAPLAGSDALVIVDAREPADYQEGHVPGAINLRPSELEETITLSSGLDVPNVMVSVEAGAEVLGRNGVASARPVCIYDEGAARRGEPSVSAATTVWPSTTEVWSIGAPAVAKSCQAFRGD